MYTPNIIIAIDPGKSTGVAIGQLRGVDYEYALIVAEVVPWDMIIVYLSNVLDHYDRHIAAVVCESFALYNDTRTMNAQIGSDFPSSQIIGMLKMLLYVKGKLDLLHMQTPSSRKQIKTIPPEHKAMVSSSPHTFDAYQHLRYFILCNYKELI